MDASGRSGQGFQVRERSGNAEALFLCAAAPELRTWSGLVYQDAAEPADYGHRPDARSARAGPGLGALRGDHAARAAGSLDIAAARGRNFGWRLRCIGAVTLRHRPLRRDVLCGVAEHPRAGAAHGAWRGRIQSIAAGSVAWFGVDWGRPCAGCHRRTGIDAIA